MRQQDPRASPRFSIPQASSSSPADLCPAQAPSCKETTLLFPASLAVPSQVSPSMTQDRTSNLLSLLRALIVYVAQPQLNECIPRGLKSPQSRPLPELQIHIKTPT